MEPLSVCKVVCMYVVALETERGKAGETASTRGGDGRAG